MLSVSHSSTERASALLKGKFRRLKYLDMNNPEHVPEMVIAACTLHNFILQHDGNDEDVNVYENTNNSSSTAAEEITPSEVSTNDELTVNRVTSCDCLT